MADIFDLLRIADSLDEINGENIGIENRDYGMHYTYLYIGMSGQKFIDKMNANLEATDAQFLAHNNALDIRIISNEMKEIKVEDGKTYYTLDGIDVPEEEKTWYSLQGEWGKIGGTLSDQEDLQSALNAKANQSDFLVLQRRVSDNYIEFQELQATVSDLSDMLSSVYSQINNNSTGILVRLNTIETTLAKKISSDQVVAIRTTDGLSLEFTTNGTTWKPVSTAGVVEWGDIIGDIENQADLILKFTRLQNQIDDIVASIGDLPGHITDYNNPHRVTAAQLGLGNVDNTSDADKPLSTAQKQYVDNTKTQLQTEINTLSGQISDIKIVNLTKVQYEALATKDANTLYFINDL